MTFTVPYVSRRRFDRTEGVNETWRFKATGIGKTNETYPYVIVNEWVSANIAQFLQLPQPPFGLFQKRDRRTLMFGSVSFEGESRPRDSRPNRLWARHPRICTGIVLFDILVANSDRHRGNIKVDDPNAPSDIFIFDHDRTLLHTTRGEGTRRFKALEGRLGISAGSVSGGNRHCLLDEIDTCEHMHHWIDRICQIPPTFVADVCERVKHMNATKAELRAVQSFLKDRCRNIGTIIMNNKSSFPNISNWPLAL